MSELLEEHGRWISSDGESFAFTRWPEKLSSEKPHFVVAAFHGMGGIAEDWEPLARSLEKIGGIMYAWEMRTHNKDPVASRHGDLEDPDALTADMAEFTRLIGEKHPETPLFIIAESMGSIIAINALARVDQFPSAAGLVLFVPVAAVDLRIGPWQKRLVRLLLKIAPRLRISLGILASSKRKHNRLCRDDAFEEYLKTTTDRLKRFTIRFLVNMAKMAENCSADAPRLKLPVLLLYSGDDIFISPPLVEAFFDSLNSADKEKRFFPEARHLLLRDPETPHVISLVENWLLSHCGE